MNRLVSLSAALLLAGCVSPGPFPSLAPREGEELAIEEPVREAPVIADDPALRARIGELIAEVRAGLDAFNRAYDEAARAAARAGAEGSDSWIEAQQEISRLEAARLGTARARADLDALALARAGRPLSADDQRALDTATELAEEIAAGQQARIDRLSRR